MQPIIKAKRLLKKADLICSAIIADSDDDAYNYRDCRFCNAEPNTEHKKNCLGLIALDLAMQIEQFLVEVENINASK